MQELPLAGLRQPAEVVIVYLGQSDIDLELQGFRDKIIELEMLNAELKRDLSVAKSEVRAFWAVDSRNLITRMDLLERGLKNGRP